MANKIRVSLLSPPPLVFEKKTSYTKMVDSMVNHWKCKLDYIAPEEPNLVITPEVCDRPAELDCENRKDYYDERGTRIRDLFAKFAKRYNSYFVYSSVMPNDTGIWYNTSLLLGPDGEKAGEYYKNHLVIEENTIAGLEYGKQPVVASTDFGKIGFVICFDLNFEELKDKYKKMKPDLMVFSSQYHGGLMQSYWAYSCRCFFAGAISAGPSEIRNPLGEVIAKTTNYSDNVTSEINLDQCVVHLDYNWPKIKNLREKYKNKVKITDPGYLGSVLITSEHESVNAVEMAKEFEIELLDDYFNRALRQRTNNISKD